MGSAENEFRVMTSGAFTAAHLELMPQVERLTKKKVVTASTSVGTGENSIPSRLKRGEVVDIVIVADTLLRQLIADGLVLEGPTPVARSAMGIAVRAGAPKPDVSTAAALKDTFLRAKCVAYSASVSGEYLTKELYRRLGIADEMLPRSRFVGGGERTGAVVARGDADLCFQQMSELLPVPGLAHVTPLPPELQKVSVFSAGVAAKCPDPALARTVIAFLASGEASKAVTSSGLELPQ
jgi:molybdate transport system substrate-binding protein